MENEIYRRLEVLESRDVVSMQLGIIDPNNFVEGYPGEFYLNTKDMELYVCFGSKTWKVLT